MQSRAPTLLEIDELVGFLPRLYAEGFSPVTRWNGGTRGADGVISMPWPEYNQVVEDFFQAAGHEPWCDYDYQPEEAGKMLENAALVNRASLAQITTMLTYCVRGERFCDGHWAGMIEGGQVRRLLERLRELRSSVSDQGD